MAGEKNVLKNLLKHDFKGLNLRPVIVKIRSNYIVSQGKSVNEKGEFQSVTRKKMMVK